MSRRSPTPAAAHPPATAWWRPYWGVLRSRWRAVIAYRAAAIGGFTTQVFWGFLRVMYLEAFYASGPGDATDFGFAAVLVYVWLGQALLGMFPIWNDPELVDGIRTDAIATELLRPVDLYSYWGWRLLAERVARVLPRATLILVVAVVVLPAVGLGEWRLPAPDGGAAGAMFAVSAALALPLGVAISIVVMLLMLWTVSSDGARLLLPPVVWFLGGLVVPLPLLPDPVRAVVELLPFAGIQDVPFRIYAGYLEGTEALAAEARQAVWLVALVALGRLLLRRGLRRVVVHAG